MKVQAGFGLSEILISLFLASLMTIVLTQLYLSCKSQYLKEQKLLEINLDLQWASDLISDSIRKAGFTPCLNIERLKTSDSRHLGRTIVGFQIENTSRSRLQINRMSEFFAEVVNILSPTQIITSQEIVSNIKHPIIISDCNHAEVHEILSINKLRNGQLIALRKPLVFSYGKTIYLGEWLEEKWFIQQNNAGENALFYKLFQTEELSPFIHEFSVMKEAGSEEQVLNLMFRADEANYRKLSVSVRSS
ncbi:hypothetical protein EP47_13245 [Legionella norrlandica]|uniref:Tfp pilus assembly protein PilW n=1 Tax=Legionella norrlandica TaxID=1498499 RepID=A0A0A2SNU8_9GAMM|nr:hypothetical protein EP47_13245 [Legionella norrlandica]